MDEFPFHLPHGDGHFLYWLVGKKGSIDRRFPSQFHIAVTQPRRNTIDRNDCSLR